MNAKFKTGETVWFYYFGLCQSGEVMSSVPKFSGYLYHVKIHGQAGRTVLLFQSELFPTKEEAQADASMEEGA